MEEECLDLISSLPSEILKLIISSIPLKAAVQTSILSTAWRSLWTPLTVILDLDSADQITSHESCEKLLRIMAMFLRSNGTPQLLKLYINHPNDGHGTPGSTRLCRIPEGLMHRVLSYDAEETAFASKIHDQQVSKEQLYYCAKAIKATDKELHLDFSGGKQEAGNYSLILESSCHSSSKILYDTDTGIQKTVHFMQKTSFSSLQTLHLKSITQLAGSLVSALFSSCLFLESLKLEKCSGLKNIDIKGNNSLQSLVVVDCPNIKIITVSAPNLRSFWYQGVLLNIQLKNTPHLVDFKLNLKDGLGENEFECEDVLSFLPSLKDIERLTISSWLLEWLCTAGVIFGRLDFQFAKLKELFCIYTKMDRQTRDSLACFLNMTPSLQKLFIERGKNCVPTPNPIFHQYWHDPHLWMDYETVRCNASQLKHLITVKLSGFIGEEDQLLLMDLLLHKALLLKKMTVISPENRSHSVSKIPRSHLQSFRQTCTVISPPGYYFVLTEEKSNGLCSENGRCVYNNI